MAKPRKTELYDGDVIDIADLLPDPTNARKHNPRNVGLIVDSLQEVGTARSGVIDENGKVLAGNATAEALSQAGIRKVKVVNSNGEEWVVVRRTGLSENQKKRLALYDNRATDLSMFDVDVLKDLKTDGLLDGMFTGDEWDEIAKGLDIGLPLDEGPEPQFDKADELQKHYGVELGQVWTLGDHRLMCGDATKKDDVAKLLGDAVPFLMVTDPPYGVDYHPEWRNEKAAEGHLAYAARRVRKVDNDTRADWREAWDLFPGDVLYEWHPPGVDSLVHAKAIQDAGFVIRMQIIWAKSHFPIGRGDYHVRHEPCWYAVRKGKASRRTDDRTQSTLWEINLDRNVDGGHSTQKPLECMARAIRNHEPCDVYDPFVGSGTTLVACQHLNRRCYAMDISPQYTAVSIQRWVDLSGNEPKVSG